MRNKQCSSENSQTKHPLLPRSARSDSYPYGSIFLHFKAFYVFTKAFGRSVLLILALCFFTQASMAQVVLSLTSTGQTGVSDTWTNISGVPLKVRITAQGGGGGNGYNGSGSRIVLGSTGATLIGEFTIQPCETLLTIAGGKGGNGAQNSGNGGGGGAGSGVVNSSTSTLLLLAAGGTGSALFRDYFGLGGSATLGGSGNGGGDGDGYSAGGGGYNSAGSGGSSNQCFSSGGGQVSLTSISQGGIKCQDARAGGAGGSGMGGGGGTSDLAGGGGGYTGGSGGDGVAFGPYSAATSYNIGTNQVNTNGENATEPNDGTVVIEIISPELPIITGTTTICNGNNTTLSVSGGTAVAEWFTGSCGGTAAGTGNSITVSPTVTTTYYARYKSDCSTPNCASVTVTVKQPLVAPTGISGTRTICEGSSTRLTVTGGSVGTDAVIEWFTGSCGGTSEGTGTSITVSPRTNTTYYVRYKNDCNTTTCVSVTITVIKLTMNTPSVTHVKCNGGSDGSINVSASGGIEPYTYAWSNSATTATITGLTQGTYSVTITDKTGCTISGSVVVNQPTALNLTKTQTNVLCNGASTGAIDLTVSGGTPSYTYKWSNNATTQDLTNIKAGVYTVTVTDGNSCTSTLTTTITQNTAIVVNAGSCQYVYYGYGSNCTNISATATGGGGTYTYKWNPGNLSGATVNVCPTSTTTYTVTATDQNRCTATATVKVEVINVICQKNKVKVCHDGITLCIDKTSVPDHLAHGDKLGTCGATACGMSLKNDVANLSRAVIKQESTSSMTLQVYPNPIEDAFKIQLENTIEGSFSFELYNISGKMVKQEKRTLKSGYNEVNMDIYELPAGMYILRAKGSNSRQMAVKISKI